MAKVRVTRQNATARERAARKDVLDYAAKGELSSNVLKRAHLAALKQEIKTREDLKKQKPKAKPAVSAPKPKAKPSKNRGN